MRRPVGKLKDPNAERKLRRHLSIRKKIKGTSERPRIAVNRSNKNLRVQVVNDESGKTLFSVQTFGKRKVEARPNKAGAKIVGARVAEEMKAKNIQSAVFDRGGVLYYGVVAALAESIREGGIQI